MAAPAVAHADTTGYVGLGYNTIDDDDSFRDSYLTLQGAMVADIAGDWRQFDAADGGMNHDSHDDAQSAIQCARLQSATTRSLMACSAVSENRTGSSFWNLGAEGQYFVGNLALSAAAMHGDQRNNGDFQTDSVDLKPTTSSCRTCRSVAV